MVLNITWFGVAFRYFGLTPNAAAKLLVPREERGVPMFFTLAASIRFLGGMNLAFAAFSLLVLMFQRLFPDARQLALFAAVLSLAHASQFACNVPMIAAHRRGQAGAWAVLGGPMSFIFAVDISLMIANGVYAVVLLAR
jgi:hypothetical protein